MEENEVPGPSTSQGQADQSGTKPGSDPVSDLMDLVEKKKLKSAEDSGRPPSKSPWRLPIALFCVLLLMLGWNGYTMLMGPPALEHDERTQMARLEMLLLIDELEDFIETRGQVPAGLEELDWSDSGHITLTFPGDQYRIGYQIDYRIELRDGDVILTYVRGDSVEEFAETIDPSLLGAQS